MRPRTAALSVGAHNPFGHPDAGALRRLIECGAVLCRTDREGALWFELSEEGVRRIDWRAGEPLSSAEARDPRDAREAAAECRAALARTEARW